MRYDTDWLGGEIPNQCQTVKSQNAKPQAPDSNDMGMATHPQSHQYRPCQSCWSHLCRRQHWRLCRHDATRSIVEDYLTGGRLGAFDVQKNIGFMADICWDFVLFDVDDVVVSFFHGFPFFLDVSSCFQVFFWDLHYSTIDTPSIHGINVFEAAKRFSSSDLPADLVFVDADHSEASGPRHCHHQLVVPNVFIYVFMIEISWSIMKSKHMSYTHISYIYI